MRATSYNQQNMDTSTNGLSGSLRCGGCKGVLGDTPVILLKGCPGIWHNSISGCQAICTWGTSLSSDNFHPSNRNKFEILSEMLSLPGQRTHTETQEVMEAYSPRYTRHGASLPQCSENRRNAVTDAFDPKFQKGRTFCSTTAAFPASDRGIFL